MSARFILLHPLALIFDEVYLHSCASLTIFQICFFTLSLGTSFGFHLVSSLHLSKLVDLFYLSSLVCVDGKDMICTMCLIYWKTMLMLAHLGFSLLKCLSMSHPSLFGWESLYLSLLVLVDQPFACYKFMPLMLYKNLSFVHGCVFKNSRGSEDSMLCTLYSNAKIKFVHVPWGAS